MANITVAGQPHDFVPIKAFRAAHRLPESFDVALFQPKSYEGLGSIDHAGAALNQARVALLESLPTGLSLQGWQEAVPRLREQFRARLNAINDQVGLREVEIDFAVAGFGDVLEALTWALLRSRLTGDSAPTFDAVYGQWLTDSARIAPTEHEYRHDDETWRVQVITNAYGRVGLVVHRPEATEYVYAASLACPAEGYMVALLRDVAAYIAAAS